MTVTLPIGDLLLMVIWTLMVGAQIGFALCRHSHAQRINECEKQIVASPWLVTQHVPPPAPIHLDQDGIEPPPPLVLSITTRCRLIHSGVRASHTLYH